MSVSLSYKFNADFFQPPDISIYTTILQGFINIHFYTLSSNFQTQLAPMAFETQLQLSITTEYQAQLPVNRQRCYS